MINSVLVTGAYGDSIELMLWDESNGYIVEEIEGLGPVDANIVSTNYASFDGSQFQSARRSPRNIIFKIGFATKHPTFSAEELRRRLSNIFRTKSQVSMLFKSDKNYLINGYVETNEPSIFSKDSLDAVESPNTLPVLLAAFSISEVEDPPPRLNIPPI